LSEAKLKARKTGGLTMSLNKYKVEFYKRIFLVFNYVIVLGFFIFSVVFDSKNLLLIALILTINAFIINSLEV